ncbi:hypothetical protein C4D60_Mb11t08910 [Musa balbisiana]|uniref:DRBM domain-containing protein n=1 Tax=Musa balbisiana TaxID=52838 RepID=A0A4S8J2S1_MUSBA|nr:hypothetical protein C4D60_Mb11t08910 [Musa balbisiana]
MNLEGFALREYTEKNKDNTTEKSPDNTKVIVNHVRYDSLPGFFNRKAAEQSAAEIALMEIHKSGQMIENLPTVHETGLCKNLLQEYAQKMNYAIPSYICTKNSSGATPFTCTVEIGGIQYIGAAARTKKEAEIKAARTALLAIQGQSRKGTDSASQYAVLPGKRKVKEPEVHAEAVKKIKPKKANFKKKWSKKRFPRSKDGHVVKSNKDEPVTVMPEDDSRVPSSNIQIEEATQ